MIRTTDVTRRALACRAAGSQPVPGQPALVDERDQEANA